MLKGLGILELSFMIQPVVRKCGNTDFLRVAGGRPAALTRQQGCDALTCRTASEDPA